METWKLVGAPYRAGYEVSNLGRVRGSRVIRNNDTQCSVKQGTLGRADDADPGYCKVSLELADGSGRKYVSVHRLVAIAFVPGDTSLDVNHKDMNKANNKADNLEWVTHSDNQRHGMKNHPDWIARLRAHAGRRRRTVIGKDLQGVETQYESLNAAGVAMGDRTKAANIFNAIHRGSVSYGRTWRFA